MKNNGVGNARKNFGKLRVAYLQVPGVCYKNRVLVGNLVLETLLDGIILWHHLFLYRYRLTLSLVS